MHSNPACLSFLDNSMFGKLVTDCNCWSSCHQRHAVACVVSRQEWFCSSKIAMQKACKSCCHWQVEFLHGSRHLTKLARILLVGQDCIKTMFACPAGQLSAANATMEESLSASGLRCLIWASFSDSVCAILGQYIQHRAAVFQ